MQIIAACSLPNSLPHSSVSAVQKMARLHQRVVSRSSSSPSRAGSATSARALSAQNTSPDTASSAAPCNSCCWMGGGSNLNDVFVSEEKVSLAVWRVTAFYWYTVRSAESSYPGYNFTPEAPAMWGDMNESRRWGWPTRWPGAPPPPVVGWWAPAAPPGRTPSLRPPSPQSAVA